MKKLIYSLKHIYCVPCDMLKLYPLQLDQPYHCSINFLGIFHYSFADIDYVSLPCLCTFVQPITIGLAIPDKTAKITHTSSNLKPMTQAKHFSGFKIIRVHDQNYFRGFRVIPPSRAESFQRIKCNSTFANIPREQSLSASQGWETPGNSYFSHLISRIISIPQATIISGSPCVTASILCIKLAAPLPFIKTSDDQ